MFSLLSGSEELVLSNCPEGASSLHCTLSPHLRLGLTLFSLLGALYHLLLYQREACPHPSPKDKGAGALSGLEGSVEPVDKSGGRKARHMLTNWRLGLGSEGKPHTPPWAGYRATAEAIGGIGNLESTRPG